MRKSIGISLIVMAAGMMPNAGAQQPAGGAMPGPPKVLVIMREYLKAGVTNSEHEKTERAFVDAMRNAKWPVHYFAMHSLSGPSRALFFTGYPSFDAWGKDATASMGNASLTQALDAAYKADSDLVNAYDSGTFALREDLSFQPNVDIAKMRFMEIVHFDVRPGHVKDWESIAKMYVDNYKKAAPDAHWAIFEQVYGAGDVFLLFHPMKTLGEVDSGFGNDKKFADAMGEEAMKKIADLSAASTLSSRSNLFMFDPKMSYPADEWVTSDPFWESK